MTKKDLLGLKETTKEQILSFDDLLNRVYAPFAPESEGFEPASLADAIVSDYPMALVDEFQDTDSIQYGIFKAVYGEGRIAYVGIRSKQSMLSAARTSFPTSKPRTTWRTTSGPCSRTAALTRRWCAR